MKILRISSEWKYSGFLPIENIKDLAGWPVQGDEARGGGGGEGQGREESERLSV